MHAGCAASSGPLALLHSMPEPRGLGSSIRTRRRAIAGGRDGACSCRQRALVLHTSGWGGCLRLAWGRAVMNGMWSDRLLAATGIQGLSDGRPMWHSDHFQESCWDRSVKFRGLLGASSGSSLHVAYRHSCFHSHCGGVLVQCMYNRLQFKFLVLSCCVLVSSSKNGSSARLILVTKFHFR
jgi:hypothetical protein